MQDLNKTFRQLQIICFSFIVLGIILFCASTVLRLKLILHGAVANPVLERYGILLALIGIPVALKIYQYLMTRIVLQTQEKKVNYYRMVYLVRLMILELVLFLNAVGLYMTGLRNFFFISFITLVAFLFCLPNKTEFLTLCESKEMEE